MIKADPLIKDTEMIMLTSIGRRGDASLMQRIGFSAYLTKPVKRSRLYKCLVSVLGKSKAYLPEEEPAVQVSDVSGFPEFSEMRKKKARILVVEDNVVNQKLAKRILEKMGMKSNAEIIRYVIENKLTG